MRLDVADVNERNIERKANVLAAVRPDQQRSDETGTAGDGDGGELVETHAGGPKRLRRWPERSAARGRAKRSPEQHRQNGRCNRTAS